MLQYLWLSLSLAVYRRQFGRAACKQPSYASGLSRSTIAIIAILLQANKQPVLPDESAAS